MKSRIRIMLKIVTDIILLLMLAIPMLTLELAIEPYQRGFFCYDESIMHPFKESTITNAALGIIGLGLPTLFILLIEAMNFYYLKKDFCKPLDKSYNAGCCNVSKYCWFCYKTIGVFLFGAGVNQDLTDVMKYSVGRLRPHFLTVCDPDFSKLNCSSHHYMTDDVCRGTDLHKIKEARLSFPSGHASMSAYTMIFLVLYLQARLHIDFSRLFKPLLQAIIFFFTLGTTVSRISDYKHHPLDITVGFLLGTTIAFFCAFLVADLFPHITNNMLNKNGPKYSAADIELDISKPADSKGYGSTGIL